MTHADSHADHPPHLQHHFDTPEQQYDSGKLGMWLFLATEILLFGGLFVAYAVYRSNHPEIFIWAQQFLDTKLGAINTVILLCSSLTMAWGVRAAQLGQRRLLVILLSLTLLGATGFLGIKYVEYKAKWEHGLLWAGSFNPVTHGDDHDAGHATGAEGEHAEGAASTEAEHAESGAEAEHAEGVSEPGHDERTGEHDAAEAAPPAEAESFTIERTTQPPPATPPQGRAAAADPAAASQTDPGEAPKNAQTFFTIYFLMTGLHGLHVIAGMAAITWVLRKALRGTFGPSYFTPVDLVGLYWHLVDLIWIFLFPLLYLIG